MLKRTVWSLMSSCDLRSASSISCANEYTVVFIVNGGELSYCDQMRSSPDNMTSFEGKGDRRGLGGGGAVLNVLSKSGNWKCGFPHLVKRSIIIPFAWDWDVPIMHLWVKKHENRSMAY